MDKLLGILQYLVSAILGMGIWHFVLFRSHRKLNKAKLERETQDVWKGISQSNNDLFLKQNDEIRELREMVSRLEQIIYKVVACKHYSVACPVRILLQEYKDNLKYQRNRQSLHTQKGNRNARDNPAVDCSVTNPDGEPP